MGCKDFKAASNDKYGYRYFQRVVFYGDSITQGLHDEALSHKDFRSMKVKDLSIVGSGLYSAEYKKLTRYAEEIKPNDLVFVSLGTNDAETARRAEGMYMNKLEKRLKTIQGNGGTIILLGLDAENSRDLKRWPKSECYARGALNANLYGLANKLGVQFVDRSDVPLRTPSGAGDGLHPKANGKKGNDYGPMLDHIMEKVVLNPPVVAAPAVEVGLDMKM